MTDHNNHRMICPCFNFNCGHGCHSCLCDAAAQLREEPAAPEDDPCKMTDSQYEEYLYGPNRAKWPTSAEDAK
jgi:hypothetical protein